MNDNINKLASSDIASVIEEVDLSGIILDDLGDALENAYEENIVLLDDNQLVKGKVVKIEAYEILVDIGYKAEGVIPLKELAIRQDIDPNELVSLGEEIEAVVLQKEDRDGRLLLSKKRAQYEKAWKEIEKVQQEGGLIKGVVIEVVKGGLMVDIGVRGFLPASLVDLRRVTELDQFVGEEIEAKILELDRQRSNVVLSRRAWLEENQKEERDELMESMLPGEVKEGVVTSVVEFGAFVDLGLIDGLVHVSELSWKRIEHPSEVVSVGDKIKVKILGVDSDKERIALSLKATQLGPWVEFGETHNVGDLVYGRVSKLVDFGAFIQVGEDVEGLVHISELASHRIESPAEVISPGEELWVKIIEIDASRRRISLSVKQAVEGEAVAQYQATDQEAAEGGETQEVAEVVVVKEVAAEEDTKEKDTADKDSADKDSKSPTTEASAIEKDTAETDAIKTDTGETDTAEETIIEENTSSDEEDSTETEEAGKEEAETDEPDKEEPEADESKTKE